MSEHAHNQPSTAPEWQCVLICWGDKYGVDIINRLASSILAHTPRPPRLVLITDREHPGLLDGIQTVRFPAFWLQPPLKRAGCQAKLVMFEAGILSTDLPAIYIDLDTIVMGDVSRLLSLQETPSTVAMLQSAIIPFGPLGRLRHRLSQGRHYARGNSSFVVFHPAHHHAIAERFRALFAEHPGFEFRPMIADERFISWAAQPHMKTIPNTLAVKFPGEFMFFWAWWLYVRARALGASTPAPTGGCHTQRPHDQARETAGAARRRPDHRRKRPCAGLEPTHHGPHARPHSPVLRAGSLNYLHPTP